MRKSPRLLLFKSLGTELLPLKLYIKCAVTSLPVWVIGSSVPHTQNIPYVSLYVSSLCCPPQQRRALHACHAPQKEPDQHGRAGTAGGADAITQGQLQRDGEPQPPPLQPDGQQCQQPQQV